MHPEATARLLISCPDLPGIVASVTGFIFTHNANITDLEQHSTDPEGGELFMRLEFQTPHLKVTKNALEEAFQRVVAERYGMQWTVSYADNIKRVAIFVSKEEHCLMELLWRWKRGELPCQIAMVVSNHPDHRESVESFGVPYHYVPVTSDNKAESEARILELLDGKIDLVVLARYMQILSPEFVARYENAIINIHHSFLPAFAGAAPYRQAHERGVKIIGATAHFVTPQLDEGPIIEQDVAKVTHRNDMQDLMDIGRDLERQVLARAVKWHLEDKVIIHGNKTIVFF
ncbi:MAG: formyltetrahydrofolate deformylase [Desulfovibrionaceae bacterium]